MSFTFGLMHGFGFAGALAQVGLPARAIPVALLFFNVGVEIGQLVFVAAVPVFARAAENPENLAALGGSRARVRDWCGRDVLGHRANGGIRRIVDDADMHPFSS